MTDTWDAVEGLAREAGLKVVTMGSPMEETPEGLYWADRVRLDITRQFALLEGRITSDVANELDAAVDRAIFFGEGDARS